MLRGFYTAAAGMMAEQRRTEMLSNNIANANTPGYKTDQAAIRAFPEMLLHRMGNETVPTKNPQSFKTQTEIGGLNTGAYLQELVPLYTQGDLRETGLTSDVALLEGIVPTNPETNLKGFLLFPVQTTTGETRYTRNGHFTKNDLGQLNLGGNLVMSTTGQPITISSNDYQITPEGNVMVEGQNVAQIDVRLAGDVRMLIKEGNGLYRTENNQPLPTAVGNDQVSYQLRQGYLEGSNVDLTQSYTDMMTAYRSFEANQKVLQAYDRSMDKAVNEIGRL